MSETVKTIDEIIELEIAKFDPFEQRMIELKEKYKGLAIVDINDKEGYENVRVAIGELRSIRTGTEKDKKVIKKPLWDACTTIEEKSKWIISEVSKIEDPLQARKDAIDAEKEKVKQEKKQAQERVFIKRSMQLSNMGVLFDGVNFILEDASYEGVLVREADDEVYNEFILPKFQVIFDKNEAIRLEELRVKQEQEEKDKAEREEFARKQAALKKEQEELEKQKAEAAKKDNEQRKAIINSRCSQLEALGMKFNFGVGAYVFQDVNIDAATEINLWTSEEWDAAIAKITPVIEERKIAIAKKEEEKKQAEIEEAKQTAIKEEQERQAKKKKEDEIKAQQEQQRKDEELAKSGDKANWEAYILKLNAVTQPAFRSGQYRKIAMIAKEKIEEIIKLKA
jgi:hypothetical protein